MIIRKSSEVIEVDAEEIARILGIKGKIVGFSTPQKNQPEQIEKRILRIEVRYENETKH